MRNGIYLCGPLLIFFSWFSSCTVYHSYNASVEEAVHAQRKMKLHTNTNQVYKFTKLQQHGDTLIGSLPIHKSKISETRPTTKNLLQEEVSRIHLKNKTLSTLIPVFIAAQVVGIIAVDNMFSDW